MRFLIATGTCVLMLAGCGTKQPTPQFSGTVSAHCENEFNGDVNVDLNTQGRLNGGLYNNAKSEGWKVDITWSQEAIEKSKSTYNFDWTYTIDAEAPTSGSSVIVYDGQSRAAIKVDDRLTIAIDPRTFHEMHPDAIDAIPVAQTN